jgi:ankyrin repeat protein
MSEDRPQYFEPAAGEGGMTKLHHAACAGDIDAVLAALEEGADVNARDHGDWTALHWVVDMGMVAGERERIVDALVAARGDVNARDLEGSTPLMIACRAGNGDLVRQLINAGAAINVCNEKGWTALMEAACYGEPDAVILLLSSGADRNAKTKDGKTALDLGRMQGWDAIIPILS